MKLNKEKRLVIYLSIIILAVGLAVFFSFEENQNINLPDDFLNSYDNVLEGSQEIVELTNQINDKIREINEFDRANQKQAAITAINDAKNINNRAKNEASNLSNNLEDMIRSISLISPESAQITALELIAIESTIIQEFINYTIALEDFLDILSTAINTNSPSDRVALQAKLDILNNKNNEINQLNQLFISKSNNLGLLSRIAGA